METISWKTERVTEILPEEFYSLIDRNREHIRKTFPQTLSSCSDPDKTTAFITLGLANQLRKENFYYYMRHLESNLLIGYVVIKNINPVLAKCELAYFVDKDFEGKGIITKAVANVLAVCFDELYMNKVYICTSLVNMASQRIALKHGFTKEGILREEFKNGDGILEDIVYFGLLESDYRRE
jgi:ribosomal-protein-serine acetyltransferase